MIIPWETIWSCFPQINLGNLLELSIQIIANMCNNNFVIEISGLQYICYSLQQQYRIWILQPYSCSTLIILKKILQLLFLYTLQIMICIHFHLQNSTQVTLWIICHLASRFPVRNTLWTVKNLARKQGHVSILESILVCKINLSEKKDEFLSFPWTKFPVL